MQNTNKRKHIHWIATISSAMAVTVAIFIVSFANGVPAPLCNGIPATIWVDGSNMLQPANVSYTGTINGTGLNDVIVGSIGADIINGRGGNDTICGLDKADEINGGLGDDTIFGNLGKDIIYGGSGNDTIHGNAGKDTIYGGSGNDFLYGNKGDDTIYGGTGNDFIKGNEHDDIICGNEGNDELRGGGGNDKIDANGDNDKINGGSGIDICLDGDVLTKNCEDTITDIVECNSTPFDPSEGSRSGRWKRCGNKRVRGDESCGGSSDLIGVAEEDADDSVQCLSIDEERMAEFGLNDMVYYHDAAYALYSTNFIEGVDSDDLPMNHKSINANGFTQYEAALKWALLANCYVLEEDIMLQGVELGFVEEGADPDKKLSQEELLNLFLTVSALEDDAYAPADYDSDLKILQRDAWQWIVDVIMLSENMDGVSKEILKSFFETGDIPTQQ